MPLILLDPDAESVSPRRRKEAAAGLPLQDAQFDGHGGDGRSRARPSCSTAESTTSRARRSSPARPAACRRWRPDCPREPARPRPMAGRSRPSPHRAGPGQPPLADGVRRGNRRDVGRLRRAGRRAQPSRAPRLSRGRVRRERLGREGDAPRGWSRRPPTASPPGSRPTSWRGIPQPAARARPPVPASGGDDPRRRARGLRPPEERIGGRSVYPYQPPGVWEAVASGRPRNTPRSSTSRIRATISTAAASTPSGSGSRRRRRSPPSTRRAAKCAWSAASGPTRRSRRWSR